MMSGLQNISASFVSLHLRSVAKTDEPLKYTKELCPGRRGDAYTLLGE